MNIYKEVVRAIIEDKSIDLVVVNQFGYAVRGVHVDCHNKRFSYDYNPFTKNKCSKNEINDVESLVVSLGYKLFLGNKK